MNKFTAIVRHELALLFATPLAYVTLAAFVCLALFAVFWAEAFFARNLADLRPLFNGMPALLTALCAALSMRSWAEEQRSGTLETLLSAPVSASTLVLGKFSALLLMVFLALLLTTPLAFTVNQLGQLDWGPVLAGYLASLSLAAAFIAIGLYFSTRSDNAIVGLILTTLACALFILLGSPLLTDLFNAQQAHWLRMLGAQSRFDAIARGVLDSKDFIFFAIVTTVFLLLTRQSVLRLRQGSKHVWAYPIVTTLLLANLFVAPFSLEPLATARHDLTQNKLYTLSAATGDILDGLDEPLTIQAFFSAQTHPLLAPLQPQLIELLHEYKIRGGRNVRLHVADPASDALAERQAAERFGITPAPFQTASRYQSGMTNAYFDIALAYGDQFETLNYEDLIDIALRGESDLDVSLRNPEYDISRAIRRVAQSYRAGHELFQRIKGEVTLSAFISPAEQLPEPLAKLREALQNITSPLIAQSGGRFRVEFLDPEAGQGQLAKSLREQHGFRPMTTSPADPSRFWFYLVLESSGRQVPVALPSNLTADDLKRSLHVGLQRFAQGVLKTIAVHAPPPGDPRLAKFGLSTGPSFKHLRKALAESVNVINTDLSDGNVPEQADLLLLLAPEALNPSQLFGLDQFLMRGGTIIAATSPTNIEMRGQLGARTHQSGMREWLQHHGINLSERLVLDKQNANFPIPVQRKVGEQTLQEFRRIPYPFFVDIRADGLLDASTDGLEQITLTWASNITATRPMQTLLQSSQQSWLAIDDFIQPDFKTYPALGFATSEPTQRHSLAAQFNAPFSSFYTQQEAPKDALKNGLIEQSAPSAKLILLASNATLTDDALDIATAGLGTEYQQPLRLMQNLVDHALEDAAILTLRNRSYRAQTLTPMEADQQRLWEWLNYAAAALGLILIWLLARWRKRTRLKAFNT